MSVFFYKNLIKIVYKMSVWFIFIKKASHETPKNFIYFKKKKTV